MRIASATGEQWVTTMLKEIIKKAAVKIKEECGACDFESCPNLGICVELDNKLDKMTIPAHMELEELVEDLITLIMDHIGESMTEQM